MKTTNTENGQLGSYCGLIDEKIKDSDKDLPVNKNTRT